MLLEFFIKFGIALEFKYWQAVNHQQMAGEQPVSIDGTNRSGTFGKMCKKQILVTETKIDVPSERRGLGGQLAPCPYERLVRKVELLYYVSLVLHCAG